MKKTRPSKPLELSWEEIGLFAQGLSFASRPIADATKRITEEYGLGPRGAWILHLIAGHLVTYPLDLTNFFRIGRSLITAELTRLTEAGLVTYLKRTDDRRRFELHLTPLGEKVEARVQEELTKVILDRFSSYSREEVLFCSRMLNDFVSGVLGRKG
jgi:DNA-binding MarR family transcriptional regulator